MPDFIPFITGKENCSLIAELYGDARSARVGLHQLDRLKDCLPPLRLWIDPTVDGLDDLSKGTPNDEKDDPRQAWYDLITSFRGYKDVAEPAFQQKPDKSVVERFVQDALDACLPHKPAAVSVPQLPHVQGSGRNKINKALAEAAAKWQAKHAKVLLILPVILNHASQSDGKVERNGHVKLAAQCLQASKAQGCWIVDASFNDEDQSADKRRNRMRDLVAFHQEFNAATTSMRFHRIGGPYWALNLLLWSRGLVDRYGIGVGTGYKYHLPNGRPKPGTAKIALEPLYRRAKVGPSLRTWFDATLTALEPSHPLHNPLMKLTPLTKLRPFATATSAAARRQTASFYRSWIDSLEGTPQVGRAMAFFQSLSLAFSYGRLLQEELVDEGATRKPESIAEPLMLNCL